MIGIFHAAGPHCRRFEGFLVQCVGEPAHDLFSEEIKLYRPVFKKDIIPHGDPFLSGRKLYSDPLAAMGDIKDRFDRHRGNLVGRSEARDYLATIKYASRPTSWPTRLSRPGFNRACADHATHGYGSVQTTRDKRGRSFVGA